MFSKKKRVTKELFSTIMETGTVIVSPLFLFRWIPSNDYHYSFVAPKAVAKKATARILLRRRGYAALRAYQLPAISGVFFYKKGALTASPLDIATNIEIILGKIRK